MVESYVAVLDRIVDGQHAVLLLEEKDGQTIDDAVAPVTELPENGRHANAIFDAEFDDGELVRATYMPEEEERRLQRVNELREDHWEPLDK